MNACKVAPSFEAGDKYGQMLLLLKEDESYWLNNDTWDVRDSVFATYGLTISERYSTKQIHFSTFKEELLKNGIFEGGAFWKFLGFISQLT